MMVYRLGEVLRFVLADVRAMQELNPIRVYVMPAGNLLLAYDTAPHASANYLIIDPDLSEPIRFHAATDYFLPVRLPFGDL